MSRWRHLAGVVLLLGAVGCETAREDPEADVVDFVDPPEVEGQFHTSAALETKTSFGDGVTLAMRDLRRENRESKVRDDPYAAWTMELTASDDAPLELGDVGSTCAVGNSRDRLDAPEEEDGTALFPRTIPAGETVTWEAGCWLPGYEDEGDELSLNYHVTLYDSDMSDQYYVAFTGFVPEG